MYVVCISCLELSASWEANRSSASQEIPRILWNLKVHYRIYNSPPPIPIRNHRFSPSPPLTPLRSILILSSHLCLDFPSGLLHSGFFTKTLYAPPLSSVRTTCPAHFSLLDLTTRKIFGEEQKTSSSLLCSHLPSAVTSSLLGPNILLSTLFSKNLGLQSSLSVGDQLW